MAVSPFKRMNLYTILCFIALLVVASSESVRSEVASSARTAETARSLLPDGNETDVIEATTSVPQIDIYKTEAPKDIEYYDNSETRWTLVDILVASFFTLAAGWLLIAIFYSLLILFLLRLQARGELDIYDEDFGTFYICGGRFSLHLSCILRRCAIQLEREYQERQMQHMRQNQGNPMEGQPREIRVMTRGERRFALETLMAKSKEGALCEDVTSPSSSDAADPDGGNVCAICLDELDHKNAFSASHICVHRFHTACIMDWLERKQNTDCPCCRKNMVSDDEIWAIVKAKRKELRRELQGDQGTSGKFLSWLLGSLGGRPRGTTGTGDDGDSSSTSGDSTESENMSRNGTRGNGSDEDGELESNPTEATNNSEPPNSGDAIGNDNNV